MASENPRTGFPETESYMRRSLGMSLFDADSFRRPLKRCQLAECQATCCYDGAFLGREEAEVIEGLLSGEADFIAEAGLELPKEVLEPADWRVSGAEPRTALRESKNSERIDGFPGHFSDTECVFLAADRRCVLQVLSEARGHHPWYWKPFACWMHPITFLEGRSRKIYLPDQDHDTQAEAGYPGFTAYTPCGAPAPGGEPAWRALAEELEFLGSILGRDFLTEAKERLDG